MVTTHAKMRGEGGERLTYSQRVSKERNGLVRMEEESNKNNRIERAREGGNNVLTRGAECGRKSKRKRKKRMQKKEAYVFSSKDYAPGRGRTEGRLRQSKRANERSNTEGGGKDVRSGGA